MKNELNTERAFTLLELLVVIAIIAILAALLFPAFSKGKQRAQGVVRFSEGKQLLIAMTMYTSDYHDFFPPKPDDGNSIPGHNWCSGKAGGGGADEFNPDVLKDPERSLLVSYLKPQCFRISLSGRQTHGFVSRHGPNILYFTLADAPLRLCVDSTEFLA